MQEVQRQDDIQTPSTSEDDQHQDNNLNENSPTNKQVIDCVEATITTKIKQTDYQPKRRPKKDSKTESSITRRRTRVTC